MNRLFFKLILHSVLILSSSFLLSQDRDIVIVLDESGSMFGDSWQALQYSLQLTSLLLDKDDQLVIVRDIQSGKDIQKIDSKTKKRSVEEIRKIIISNGTNHQRSIDQTVDYLKTHPKREKIVVYINDGDVIWSKINCSDLVKLYPEINSRHYYLFMRNSSTQEEFLRRIKSIPLLEEIRTSPGDVDNLFKQLQNLAKRIVGADLGTLPLSFSSNKVKFKTEVPITKFIVVNQSEGKLFNVGELVNVKTTFPVKWSDKIEIFNNKIAGKFYEVSDESNTVIPVGTEVEIEFNSTIDKSKLIILPITTLQLKVEVIGNILDHNKVSGTYIVCESENEVEVLAYLVDKAENKINLDKLGSISFSLKSAGLKSKMSFKIDEAAVRYELKDEESYLTVEALYKGYFQKNSEAIKIIRKQCPHKLHIKISGVFKDTHEANKTYKVCTEQRDFNVLATIIDDKNALKKLSDINDGAIIASVNGKEVKLAVKGDIGDEKIQLVETTTKVKFKIISGKSTIYESDEYNFIKELCGPIKDNSVLDLGNIPMMTFTKDGHCMQVYMKIFDGRDSLIVAPDKYTLSIMDIPRGLKVEIDTLGKFFNICFTKSPYLCDCFIAPGTFSGTIIATPVDENLAPVEKVWKLTLEKEKSFWVRCQSCIIIAIALGIVLWYLYGIWTKPRFKEGARLELSIYDSPNPRIEPDYRRKRLKTSFFNRYVIPYISEKYRYEGITYIATKTSSILIDKNTLTENLFLGGEQLKPEGKLIKNDIRFTHNSELKIESDKHYIFTIVKYLAK